jgi:hypothetical protein
MPPRKRNLQTPIPGPGGLAQIAVTLPKATLEMLEREAAMYGWRKGQFLDALLMQKLNMGIKLERQPNAPKYRFKPADWKETERWIWYIRPDLKEKYDALRLRAGNIRSQSWIVMVVNQWVGLPTGLEGEA